MGTKIIHVIAVTMLLAMAETDVCAQSVNVLIGNPEQNVIYADVDNPLLVQVPEIAYDKLTVTCQEAKIFQQNEVWYVHPRAKDSIDWVSVNVYRQQAKGKNVLVGNKQFRVRNVPQQLACIVTPTHVYRTGDKVPVAELIDSTTRIVPKHHEYVDYPEPDLVMEKFVVVCQRKVMRCTDDTLSSEAKVAIMESLTEREDVDIVLQLPRIGKRTNHSVIQRVLQSSTFTIVK